MSGLRVYHFKNSRFISLALSVAFYYYLVHLNSFSAAMYYFIIATVVHYLFLFGIFMKNGIADSLIKKFGEEKAFLLYEVWMGVVFFHNGASSGYIIAVNHALNLSFISSWILLPLGIICFIAGFGIKIWATLTVGVDAYYYKDLFHRKSFSDFKVSGPYKYFANPMYGIGHLYGYGTALLYGSLMGLLAIFLNQMLVFLFYYTIEKPHVKRVFVPA